MVLPDPSIVLRGLDRLVGKVLGSNPTLQFRINLVRTTLMVDSVPTKRSIEQLAECVLAEMDQVSNVPPKLKKMEEDAHAGEPPKKGDEAKREQMKCRFFLTENGCRRGKSCKWSHDQKDDQKRCWCCGSIHHFSSKCPLKAGVKAPKVSKAEKEKEAGKTKKGEEEDAKSDRAAVGQGEDMKTALGRSWKDVEDDAIAGK